MGCILEKEHLREPNDIYELFSIAELQFKQIKMIYMVDKVFLILTMECLKVYRKSFKKFIGAEFT